MNYALPGSGRDSKDWMAELRLSCRLDLPGPLEVDRHSLVGLVPLIAPGLPLFRPIDPCKRDFRLQMNFPHLQFCERWTLNWKEILYRATATRTTAATVKTFGNGVPLRI
eukprot:scaffold5237_cov179-Amphora_coffeaeformis.AAC.2